MSEVWHTILLLCAGAFLGWFLIYLLFLAMGCFSRMSPQDEAELKRMDRLEEEVWNLRMKDRGDV